MATAHRTGSEPVQFGTSSPTSLDGPARSLAPCSPSPRFVWLDEVDSTNAYAARHLGELQHGTFVVADRQSAGRGRNGRFWLSPPGGNVYMSGVVKAFPAVPSAALPGALTLAMALAVCDAIEREGVAPTLKWPNDVLVDGKKVAGILAQAAYEGPRAASAIVGVGINVNMTAVELAAIDRPATSLAVLLRRTFDARSVAWAVAERFLDRLPSVRLSAFRSEVSDRMLGLDEPIVLVTPSGTLAGRSSGLAEDFRLRVVEESGRIHLVSVGETCSTASLYRS